MMSSDSATAASRGARGSVATSTPRVDVGGWQQGVRCEVTVQQGRSWDRRDTASADVGRGSMPCGAGHLRDASNPEVVTTASMYGWGPKDRLVLDRGLALLGNRRQTLATFHALGCRVGPPGTGCLPYTRPLPRVGSTSSLREGAEGSAWQEEHEFQPGGCRSAWGVGRQGVGRRSVWDGSCARHTTQH